MNLQFYKDFNSHIACVYQRDAKRVSYMMLAANGLQLADTTASEFARKYTRPVPADSRKAALKWYCRALTKTRNNPRAFSLLGEIIMTKDLETMTLEEMVEHHNEIATEMGKPTVETFKSLKAARAAVAKLTKPAKAPKAAKEPVDPEKLGRGPIQGVGAFAKELILEGLDNKEVLKRVQEQFPTAKTSVSCISYYRSKLVFEGQLAKRIPKKAQVAETEAEAEAA